MRTEALRYLRDTLGTLLPSLNQVKRVVLLDGVVHLLLGTTDYSDQTIEVGSPTQGMPSLEVATSILSCFPKDLVVQRYSAQLSTWFHGFYQNDDVLCTKSNGSDGKWLEVFCSDVSAFLRTGQGGGGGVLNSDITTVSTGAPGGIPIGERLEGNGTGAGGLCVALFVLSEALSESEEDEREQAMSRVLYPLTRVLDKCYSHPYIAPGTLFAALAFLSEWVGLHLPAPRSADPGMTAGGLPWRLTPLRRCVDEVVELIASRLESVLSAGALQELFCGGKDTGTRNDHRSLELEAGVLIDALSSLVERFPEACFMAPQMAGATNSSPGEVHNLPSLKPCLSALRRKCVAVISPPLDAPPSGTSSAPSPTTAGNVSTMAVATATIGALLRGLPSPVHGESTPAIDVCTNSDGEDNSSTHTGWGVYSGEAATSQARDEITSWKAMAIVSALLTYRIGDRPHSMGTAGSGRLGCLDGWGRMVKLHEQCKWACLSKLLPFVFGPTLDGSSPPSFQSCPGGQLQPAEILDSLMDSLQGCIWEDLPVAMACLRDVVPAFLLSTPPRERGAELARLYELMWSAFSEVRRQQPSLVNSMVAALFHPVLMALPGVSGLGDYPLEKSDASSTTLAGVFDKMLEAGMRNRPKLVRALVGRCTAVWRQNPDTAIPYVSGVVNILLYREWKHSFETTSNGDIHHLDAVSEDVHGTSPADVPRLAMLLFIEKNLIPMSSAGDQ
ncbi:unnamed protein product, partial [Discosporangium mesarthrocarpum]